MIEVEQVTKTYKLGDHSFDALKSVSLKIEKGEFVAILGSSGSGKSTLMHLIGGLDRPTSGKIVVDGEDLSTINDSKLARFRNEKIGFVFQFFNLLPTASTLNNVIMPLIYTKKKGVQRVPKATEVLTSVGLGEKLRNRPNQLSGGEQQRVSLARALVNDPEIILADEPTGNLDSKTGEQIFELLTTLNKQGKTVIVVTHDQDLATAAGRIIRLKDGEVVT